MNPADTPYSLGTEPLKLLLSRYALPAILAMTSSSLYHIVDSIFIGHGVGAMALAGIALTMPLMSLASAFGAMIGIGGAAIISIRLGQGSREGAERVLGNVVMLSGLIGIVYSIVMSIFLDPLLYFFGASEQTIPYAREFMQVILCGTVVTHLYLGLNDMLRASGYPRKAMQLMLTTVGVNILLNPLFIFVFGWGIRGSAIATVIAQVVALAISLTHFSNTENFLHFRRDIFRWHREIVESILSIGMAPFLLNVCAAVVVLFVNRALSYCGGESGDIYIGAFGIVNRMVLLFVMIVMGLNQGMQPIVGYNYGARQYTRVVKTLRMTIFCAICVTTTGFLISQFLPRQVAMLFVGSAAGAEGEAIIDAAAIGLRTVLMFFPIVGFQIITSGFFQYIGKPRKAILLSMTRQLLFLVPLLTLLPPRYGVVGVWSSMPIADAFSALLAAILLYRQLRKFRRHPAEEHSI